MLPGVNVYVASYMYFEVRLQVTLNTQLAMLRTHNLWHTLVCDYLAEQALQSKPWIFVLTLAIISTGSCKHHVVTLVQAIGVGRGGWGAEIFFWRASIF